jgi:hypothetical protein
MADPIEIVAGLVMPDGQRWGEVAAPWQWEICGRSSRLRGRGSTS